MIKELKKQGHFRNIQIAIAAAVIVTALLLAPFSPLNAGLLGEWLGFVLGASTSLAIGTYSHRVIFKDMRPHQHKKTFADMQKASMHRLIWVLSIFAGYVVVVIA